MSDLISRLSEKLDEVERVARAACHDSAGTWTYSAAHPPSAPLRDDLNDVVVYDEGSPSPEQFAHIALWDPKAVLRLVTAHRKVVAEHQPRNPTFRLLVDGDLEPPRAPVCVTCIHGLQKVLWPCATVLALAEGWGLEVES